MAHKEEGVFGLTSVINAKERHDIMLADIPNTFIQAEIPTDKGEEKIIMKIIGKLVDILVRMAPKV